MDQVLRLLGHLPPVLIYPVAAVLVGSETATLLGLVAPGEITLLIVGFLCYTGVLRVEVALPVMLAAGLAGDVLGYLEGRRTGPRLRESRLARRIDEKKWRRAEALMRRYGGRAVFLARFLAFARTLVPRLVGMSGVGWDRFLPWDVMGVLGCVGGTFLVGYAAGGSYATAADLFGRATGALLALVLVIVAIVLIGRYLGRHPDPVAALGNRLLRWPPLRFVGRAYRAAMHRLVSRLGLGGALAVNVLAGVVALLGIGYGLTWVVDRLVRHSGLPLVDPLVMNWIEARREPGVTAAATDLLSVLRGSYLVVLVGVVAAALSWRYRGWRSDLIGLLSSSGAFVPLALIALATDWERGAWVAAPAGRFGNQIVVVSASVGMLAWLLSRRLGWGFAVTVWTAAVAVVVVVAAARVYVGWSWPSEAVASILLGALWVLVFVIGWYSREPDGLRNLEDAGGNDEPLSSAHGDPDRADRQHSPPARTPRGHR